jgi:hypothetical protein
VPLVVPAELPTPDVVVVRGSSGSIVVFVDPRVPRDVVDETLADLDTVLRSRPYALA